MRIKGLLLIIIVLLTCGCSANYHLEFKNNKLIEKVEVFSTEDSLSSQFSTFSKYFIPSFVPDGNYDFDENMTKKLKDIEYYKSKYNAKNGLFLSYKYNFKRTNYDKSFLPNYSSEYFDYIEKSDKYIFSTGSRFQIFDEFKHLDKITVHIKSNHKLIDTNADEVDGYNYYWYLDRNSENKNIYLELSKKEKVRNYENSIIKTIIITLSILLVIGMISLALYRKARDLNKIY